MLVRSVALMFRGCRYEVYVHTPNRGLWSRHFSIAAARRSYREAVNNRRGDHSAGTLVELADIAGGGPRILDSEVVHP
jgi:hypothetical protein